MATDLSQLSPSLKAKYDLAIKSGYSADEVEAYLSVALPKYEQEAKSVESGYLTPANVSSEAQFQLQQRGYKPAPSDAELKEQQAKSGVGGLINELQFLYNQPNAGGQRPNQTITEDLSMGRRGVPSFISNLGGNAKAALNLAPDAKTYGRLKRGFSASLKEATGDTGVLTDQDRQFIMDALPNFGDSDETARRAWESVENILSEKGVNLKFNYGNKTPVDTLQDAGVNLGGNTTQSQGGGDPLGIL